MGWLRRWLAKLMLAVAIPAAALVALESGLRFLPYGIEPSWTVRAAEDPAAGWHDNPDIGTLWFAPGLVRSPVPFRSTGSTDGLRVVVLGESAAMGDPAPAFGLAPQLEALLRAAYPGTSVEVINAAMTAIDSSVIVDIARAIARLNPDAVIVYMGNNEAIGPFGPPPGTRFLTGLEPWYARAVLAARGTRTGQGLRRFYQDATDEGSPGWRGLAQFSDRVIAPDSPVLDALHRRYAANLEAVLTAIRRAGAAPVLATVASQPFRAPFAARNASGATSALAAWHESLDLLARGETAAARVAWQRSRDLDPVRFRADSAINDTVRAVAGRATVLDVEASLLERPDAAALFWDHVHFTPEGNYEVARLFADTLAPLLEQRGFGAPRPWLSRREALDALIYTPWDDLNTTALMHTRLLRPPFVAVADHQALATGITARLRTLRNEVDLRTVTAARDRLIEACRPVPIPPAPGARLLRILEELEQWDDAWAVAQRLATDWPHVRAHQHALGRHLVRRGDVAAGMAALERGEVPGGRRPAALARIETATLLAEQGRMAEALALLDRVITATPWLGKAWYNRAVVYSRLGQLDNAERDFRQALASEPDMVEAFNNLGVIALKRNRPADAERHFRQALEHVPGHASALRNQILVLRQRGARDEADALSARLAGVDPDAR
jgi:Flp pilus assembly protein TadD/lysophospholipase L1-like esterase